MSQILESFDRFCLKHFTGQTLKSKINPESVEIHVFKKVRPRYHKGIGRTEYFFHTPTGKTGFAYVVSEKKLQITIDRLPSKHGIVRQLVVKYDKRVKMSSLKLDTKVLCKAKVGIVRLTTKDTCVILDGSTVCGVPFPEWLSMAEEGKQPYGKCRCKIEHSVRLKPGRVLCPKVSVRKRPPETQHNPSPPRQCHEHRSQTPVSEENARQSAPVTEEQSATTDDSGRFCLHSRGTSEESFVSVTSGTSVEADVIASSGPGVATDPVLYQDALLRLSLLLAAYRGADSSALPVPDTQTATCAGHESRSPIELGPIPSQDTVLRLWLLLAAYHDLETSLGFAFACTMGELSDSHTGVLAEAKPHALPVSDTTLSPESLLRLWLLFAAYYGVCGSSGSVSEPATGTLPVAQGVAVTDSEANSAPPQDALLRLWILFAAFNSIEAGLGAAVERVPSAAHSEIGAITGSYSSQADPSPSTDILQRLRVLFSAYYTRDTNSSDAAGSPTNPFLDAHSEGSPVAEPDTTVPDSYTDDLLAMGAQLGPVPSGDPDLDLDTDSDLDEFYDVDEYPSAHSVESAEAVQNYDGPLSESALMRDVAGRGVSMVAEPPVSGLPPLVLTQPTKSEMSIPTPLVSFVGSPSVRPVRHPEVLGSGVKSGLGGGISLATDLGEDDTIGLDHN